MTNRIEIRQLMPEDIVHVAKVHEIAFRGFFLTSLGRPFLRKYYQLVLRYKNSISMVAVDPGLQVIGFAVGFSNPDMFYKFLKRQWFCLLPSICYAFIRRPYLLCRIIKAKNRVIENSKPLHATPNSNVELASIASVSKASGVGSLLMKAFFEKAKSLDANGVTLTTDRKSNDDVLKFYAKHGFAVVSTKNYGDREMLVLSRNF